MIQSFDEYTINEPINIDRLIMTRHLYYEINTDVSIHGHTYACKYPFEFFTAIINNHITIYYHICQLQFEPIINPLKYSKCSRKLIKKNIAYFEIEILDSPATYVDGKIMSAIGIGLAGRNIIGTRHFVGWYDDAIGYHNDTGSIYDNNPETLNDHYLKYYSKGDIIGVEWDVSKKEEGEINFYVNGKCITEHMKLTRPRKVLDQMVPTLTAINSDDETDILFRINRGRNVIKYPFKFQEANINTFNMDNINNFVDITICNE